MTLHIEQLGLVPYRLAYDHQMQLLEKLYGDANEDDICLILQHPSVFTLGRHGSLKHIMVARSFLEQKKIELIKVERGGEVTYHGPGQIVCYPLINLRKNRMRVVEYVHTLEQIMLEVVSRFAIEAGRDTRNHGIWRGNRKLGSVGIAVRHGISYHGLALNVNPELEPFSWINPCGLTGVTMSSMDQELGQSIAIEEVEQAMVEEIGQAFAGRVKRVVAKPAHCRQKQSRAGTGKPKWLKKPLPRGSGYERTRRLLQAGDLHTVCREARCPNQFECFGRGTATFMLMGDNCTRNCRFCAVNHGVPEPLADDEPARVAAAVAEMGLSYTVLTSVTRDDLADGGARHFSRTLEAIRKLCPQTRIEILIPDLQGNNAALELLCQYEPSVLNHNLETVEGLYAEVRPQGIYDRSLELLTRVKEFNSHIVTKSGLMLGLGETREELKKTMADIRNTGCDLLTLGQYLQPTGKHLTVQRYVVPEEFDRIRETALELGFAGVAAGPHVRSSFQAAELYQLAA